jgi:hypothetical protein
MLNGNDYSTGNPYTVGTWGLGTFNNYSLYGGNGSVPTLYAFHIESVTPSDLSVKLSGMGIDTSNGEADPFAYMVLDLNEESISRYTSDGKLIGSGPVSISTSYNMIEIKTSETGNILAPYSYRNKGNKVQSYYMRFNRQEPGSAGCRRIRVPLPTARQHVVPWEALLPGLPQFPRSVGFGKSEQICLVNNVDSNALLIAMKRDAIRACLFILTR